MQAGERRFAERLVSHLEDDYTCWYELPVGVRQRYSDFIVLHPARGLLLLEVKDWKLENLQSINKVSATLLTGSGVKTVSNPLEQARQCAYRLVNQLERDPQLVNASGRYQGKLVFPFGYGVVLTSITRRQFDATDLGEVLPAHQTICKDEMTASVDPEAFQMRLWEMFNFVFSRPLSLPQVDRIRWHLFPEVRINQGTFDFSPSEAEASSDEVVPDIVQVMDTQQELLARSLGDGHRVIHGVAGSGKTLILGFRCLHLARTMNKPILVLCYNITLAARLREMMAERGLEHQVSVYHFHDWCGEQARIYHIQTPAYGPGYPERLVECVINAVEKGSIPRAQYGAVMIDEGHDFEADWLKLIVGMVDPDTNSFLLLYDDAQSIYSGRSHLDFSLSSVGVQARGRTRILKLNYRNTYEILQFAYGFASYYLSAIDKDEDHIPLVQPEAGGRHGPKPVLKSCKSFAREAEYIALELSRLNRDKGIGWSDMCVLYRDNWMGKKLQDWLQRKGLPLHWLATKADKQSLRQKEQTVKLMTMHSSKGLEFPVVVICGLGYLPNEQADPTAEAKLLYVAMTRATEKLVVTSHQESEFFNRLKKPQRAQAVATL